MQSDDYGSQVQEFIKRTESLGHIKYKLWDKDLWMGLGDCSALFAWYGYLQGKREFKTVQWSMNTSTLIGMWATKYIQEWLSMWDLMFFDNVDWWVNHIAMVISYKESETWYVIEIIDLSARYNVSRRTIDVSKEGEKILYEVEWEKYYIKFATNVLFDREYKKQKMTTIKWLDYNIYYNPNNKPKEFAAMVTTYIPPVNWDSDNINCGWGSCKHTANGTELTDDLAGKLAACPMQFPHWTKLMIEWHGEVTCVDRWGLIVMRSDINTRGNVSSMNRIDVFAGNGTSKIELSKSVRKVIVL